jgi:hypothetical protein
MHGAARRVDEVADARRDPLVSEQKAAFALEDVERLVLAAVDVGGGPPPGATIASIAMYAPPVSAPVTRNRYTSPGPR